MPAAGAASAAQSAGPVSARRDSPCDARVPRGVRPRSGARGGTAPRHRSGATLPRARPRGSSRARRGTPFPRPRGSGTPRRGLRRRRSARSAGTCATEGHAPSGRLRGGGEEAGDGLHVALPRRRLGLQVLPAGGGEPVEAGPLSLVGEPPLAVHQPPLLEAVPGGTEGSVGDVAAAGGRGAGGT